MLHIVALAQYAAVYTRSWAADSANTRVRLRAERDQLEQEVVLLREEIRIKDARMAALSAHRRPFYPPTQRMAILELRAARGWSLEQAAERFLVCSKTIASWMKRLDESGSDALVQVSVPVNKFPDFVRYAVQRLQALCPTLGKKKLAEVLARRAALGNHDDRSHPQGTAAADESETADGRHDPQGDGQASQPRLAY